MFDTKPSSVVSKARSTSINPQIQSRSVLRERAYREREPNNHEYTSNHNVLTREAEEVIVSENSAHSVPIGQINPVKKAFHKSSPQARQHLSQRGNPKGSRGGGDRGSSNQHPLFVTMIKPTSTMITESLLKVLSLIQLVNIVLITN